MPASASSPVPPAPPGGAAPGDGLQIRPARPDEYAEAGALVETAYATGGLLDNDRGYGEHLRDVTGRADHHEVLVALRDGRIVGSVTVTPHGTPQSEMAREGESEFRYLGVAPDARGTGVGEALVAACEERAVAQGASRIVICVISDNTRAHRFYDRLGFARAPERDWVPVPQVTLWAFTREVGAAPAG